MSKKKLTLIYISRENISFYRPEKRKFLSTPVKNGLIDDMSITDEDALALFVNEFVKANAIELDHITLILSKELLFVKTYKDIIELEIDRENFITNIPFNPAELTFVEENNSSGAYSVAANRGLCVSLKTAFEKAGFDVDAVIPDDINSTKLTSNGIGPVSKKDLEKLDFMKPRSAKNPKYKNKVDTKQLASLKKSLAGKLPIIIGVVIVLCIGTAYLIITSLGKSVAVISPTDAIESTESASEASAEPTSIAESPFALEIDDVSENNTYKGRGDLKITFIDNPQAFINEDLFVTIKKELSESGFPAASKTTGESYAGSVTVIEYSTLVSDDDLFAISDYLYTRFEDVRREKFTNNHVGEYDIIIKAGKILD